MNNIQSSLLMLSQKKKTFHPWCQLKTSYIGFVKKNFMVTAEIFRLFPVYVFDQRQLDFD